MTTSNARPKGAQLIGSVPLESVEVVMTTLCDALGQHIERLPDGELGNRAVWIAWQRAVFNKLEGFENVTPRRTPMCSDPDSAPNPVSPLPI